HAHLEDEQLAPILTDILEHAKRENLVGVTAIGTTLETSKQCLSLAEEHSIVSAAVGIHPNHCQDATESQWKQILEIAPHDSVVAIGETGLDRYWDYCPIETQRIWFAKHIELSFDLQKPLVIHMRDCESDILEMLNRHQQNGRIIGILHSFAGSLATAEACLNLGMYISFAGMVTFKKSIELREVAKVIPADRILVETDSPYLSPHPFRGKRPNQPKMVRYTAECLADVRGTTLEEFSEITTRNAERVFGLVES
ncbi:MAG: TatD family hydrolase, partial [Planctomycetota bacterium]